jgi:hypothetical protein
MSHAPAISESLRKPMLSDAGRERSRQQWRATICEIAIERGATSRDLAGEPRAQPVDPRSWEAWRDAHQEAAAHASDLQLLLISSWNPWSLPLSPPVNAARDHLLRDELVAWGCAPLRSRGRSLDGTWREDGWAVAIPRPASPTVTSPLAGPLPWWSTLLRRYGQLALFCFQDGCRYLGWCDGRLEAFPVHDPSARP